MKAALTACDRTLDRMDADDQESGGPWLLGKKTTLADIAVMPAIVRMADLGLDSAWADKPTVARWLEQIRGHKAYTPTYYFGSLLTERFPHLKDRKLSA